MISIEEYIAKRKKEDRLNEFNIDERNEIFNESESLEMAECLPQIIMSYPDKGYYNVSNFESSNHAITNYANMLKIIIGEKGTFEGMYIDPIKMFEDFNREYKDIFQDEFGNNKDAWGNLICQIKLIKKDGKEEDHLVLNKLLAKCYERKITKYIDNISDKQVEQELKTFKSNMFLNKDKQVLQNYEHYKIFKSIHELNLSRKNKVTEQKEEPVDIKREFVKNLVDEYVKTESNYEYESRKEDEQFSVKRIIDAAKSQTFRGNNAVDIQPKLIKEIGETEFKRQYSRKQISAMAQLLIAADNLTKSSGKNYLDLFINIPDIDYILSDMAKNDEYIQKMTPNSSTENKGISEFSQKQKEADQRAQDNSTENKGIADFRKKLRGELDVPDDSTDTTGDGLNGHALAQTQAYLTQDEIEKLKRGILPIGKHLSQNLLQHYTERQLEENNKKKKQGYGMRR